MGFVVNPGRQKIYIGTFKNNGDNYACKLFLLSNKLWSSKCFKTFGRENLTAMLLLLSDRCYS